MRNRRSIAMVFLAGAAVSVFVLLLPTANGESDPNGGPTMKLPKPELEGTVSVEEALQGRRSVRRYKDDPLTLAEVSQLLWAAQGITDEARGYRTAPSAGALYPLEVTLVVGTVTGLDPGVYKYDPREHELEKLDDGDKRAALADAALGQGSVRTGAVDIVFTAIYERVTGKYRERGVRYTHMEAGHAAQNVYLQAESLGLGTVVIGAFDDDAVAKVVGTTDDRERPLYIMPVGRK